MHAYLTTKETDATTLYAVHQFVWGLLPKMPSGVEAPYLFTMKGAQVLIRTPLPLDDTSKKEEIDFKVGDRLYVQVVLNPVKRSQGKECPIKGVVGLKDYGQRIFEAAGLRVLPMEMADEEDESSMFVRLLVPELENSKNIPIHAARYNASVEVVDVDIFQNALLNGVGRKKRFGCGMMLFRR